MAFLESARAASSRSGRPHGLEVIGPCHIRRIEAGILAYGADMWLDSNPFEVDMGYPWMVDLDQEADVIGKDALRRIKAEGKHRSDLPSPASASAGQIEIRLLRQ